MLSIGQRLQEERLKKNISLEEVAKITKIKPKFLAAIEKGEYKKLPSSAYAQGFVRNYIEFLGLPSKESLALFKREFNEKEFLDVLPESFISQNTLWFRGLRFRQTGLVLVGIFVLIFLFLFFQYRGALFNPSVMISEPRENRTYTTQSLTVTGKTDQNNTVTINDIPAYVDQNGNFRKEVPVFPGQQTIIILITNTFGKRTVIKRDVIIKTQ